MRWHPVGVILDCSRYNKFRVTEDPRKLFGRKRERRQLFLEGNTLQERDPLQVHFVRGMIFKNASVTIIMGAPEKNMSTVEVVQIQLESF
jgi:phage terminase large subunit-like protein